MIERSPLDPQTPSGRLLLLLGPFAAIAAGLFTFGLGLWLVTSDIPNIRGDELYVVYSVQKLLAGGPLYGDPARPPFDITQYPPLYYVITAGLARAAGIASQDAAGVTLLCRGVSFALTMMLLLVMYRFMRRQLHIGGIAAATACGFSIATTSPWYFMARPDTLMALCLVCAIYAAVISFQREGRAAHAWIVVAALFSVLATVAKQNGVQAFGVLFLAIGLSGAWARLVTVTVVYLLVGSLAAMLTHNYLGSALMANLVEGLDNGVSFYGALWNCFDPFFPVFALLVAFAFIIVITWFRPRSAPIETLMAVSLVCLLGFATATALKVGSAVNYFNEFKLLAAMAVAAFLAHGSRILLQKPRPVGQLELVVSLYLVFFLSPWSFTQFYQFCFVRREPGHFVSAKSLRYEACDPAVAWLRQEMAASPGMYVMSFDLALNTALAEYSVLPQRGLNEIAYARGVVDYRRLKNMLNDGSVRFLVTKKEQIPAAYFGTSLSPFKFVNRIAGYSMYEHQSTHGRVPAKHIPAASHSVP
ncbi:MAG: hypothetical protein ACYC0X_00310 [Pirellulaceae bacterium]